MNQRDDSRKNRLLVDLQKCIVLLRGYSDLDSLVMPLFYILCAHHEGHLVSLVGKSPNYLTGEKHIQPLLDAEGNNAESDLLRRIRTSVDERYFHGQTAQVFYDFYARNNKLITEFYTELIEHIFKVLLDNSGRSSGLFTTPIEVTQLMYKLALQVGTTTSVYDPCAGLCTGATLPEMAEVKFVGQDINNRTKLLAEIRMTAHEKTISISQDDVTQVWRGDEANCLCSDLPMGVKLSDSFSINCRPQYLDDYVVRQFVKTPSLKRAVVLTSLSTSWRRENFDLRKTLVEKNYVDTIIELPKGILPFTSITTIIIVLDKERATKDIRFVSSADCVKIDNRNKSLDVEKVLRRIESNDDDQACSCNIEETYKYNYSLLPSEYIKDQIELLPGQQLVKLWDIATDIWGERRFEDSEGFVLTEKDMCESIAEFHSIEHTLEQGKTVKYSQIKIVQPCIIFNSRFNKFFIKSNNEPLFIPRAFHAISVDSMRCIPEYIVLELLKSKKIKDLMEMGAINYDIMKSSFPIFTNLKSQRQIVEREYRKESQLLRKKMEKLQALSGGASDLLHNLGVTFTKLSAGITALQSNFSSGIVTSLDENIQFALRLINSTGTDFTKATPTKKKVILQELVEKYLKAWPSFGYNSFNVLPLKSSISNTKLEVDPDLLFTALDCIFINAHQHGFNKHESEQNHVLVELKAVTINDEKYALISVSNNGEPLPDGFTLQDFITRGVVGLNSSQDGLGGHHVASIAHLHEGHVSIESGANWLSFNILLPIYINAKDTTFEEYECEYL